jgi:hypothetical protein
VVAFAGAAARPPPSVMLGVQRNRNVAAADELKIRQLPPHLAEANWIETVMIQLATVVAQTRVMRGGHHRSIRSHCMVFDATLGPPATLLPSRVDRNGSYKVV